MYFPWNRQPIFCHGSVSQHIVPIVIVYSEFTYDVMQLFTLYLATLCPDPTQLTQEGIWCHMPESLEILKPYNRLQIVSVNKFYDIPLSSRFSKCLHNKCLCDFICRSALLELTQRFELVTPDPFSWCKLGGVTWFMLGLVGSGLWDYFHIFSCCWGNHASP